MFSCEIFLVKKCSLEALNEANHHAKKSVSQRTAADKIFVYER